MQPTAVALIIFNRPDITEQVLRRIALAKPKRLFVIADGPRPNRPGEAEKCAAVRSIIDRVNWDCEVVKNYSDVNLGCAVRVASGLTWLFEQVDHAIILEDDCIPHSTFFEFCEELLERYSEDERVMQICGYNPLASHPSDYSYYFSRMVYCWGWATWARAWKRYDLSISGWPKIRETSLFMDIAPNPAFAMEQTKLLDATYKQADKWDTWDYQWGLTVWAQYALTVMPMVNLVSNVGFGPDATHTKGRNDPFYRLYGDLPVKAIQFPLRHPPYMIRDYGYDQSAVEYELRTKSRPGLYRRVRNKLAAAARHWAPSIVPAKGGSKLT